MKTKIAQIRFSEEQIQKIKRQAEKENKNMSEIIRERSIENPIEKKLDQILKVVQNESNK